MKLQVNIFYLINVGGQGEKLRHCNMLPLHRRNITLACHAHSTSGYLGVKKTIARVKERFTWKGVIEDVKKMVR